MTRCLGNTEHLFIGAALLFHTHHHPPTTPSMASTVERVFFPFVPAVFLMEDMQSPLSTFPTCVGAHSLHHRLTCPSLISGVNSWLQSSLPPCCGRGFFVSVAQQSTHAHLTSHLVFVKNDTCSK